ncbi:MAG: hypothetical protein PUP93_01200 [Rhizonema sp. NSF051]|nr:hypothetical protein [Rhizonema sp. NSF051]
MIAAVGVISAIAPKVKSANCCKLHFLSQYWDLCFSPKAKFLANCGDTHKPKPEAYPLSEDTLFDEIYFVGGDRFNLYYNVSNLLRESKFMRSVWYNFSLERQLRL